MEPDYVTAIIKKVINDYFADCIINAEFSIDKEVYNRYKLSKADMEKQIMHQINCKFIEYLDSKIPKLQKREDSFRVTLTAQVGIFTVKELESLITISAAHLGEEKK